MRPELFLGRLECDRDVLQQTWEVAAAFLPGGVFKPAARVHVSVLVSETGRV